MRMARRTVSRSGPIRLAVWFGKGGVGKSTTTMMLSLFTARARRRILTIDLDPECGTSRDFLGKELPQVGTNVKTFLESPLPVPPPVLPSGIDHLDIVPCAPDEQRFFRLYPEKSTKLRDSLDLLPPIYDWILMDVPNQFDNIAELGLIAAQYLLLPVELTADCVERVQTGLRIIREARAFNPDLTVIGALALASVPRAGQPMGLSAKERLILREYEEVFRPEGIQLFKTLMFRSATTVEEARSNADERMLHWTARRRFRRLLAEIHSRISTSTLSRSPVPYGRRHRTTQQSRAPAKANA
jgi:cellulose biosynthesis protein BcsQ